MAPRFSIRGRNPDILTCIANLSNDEVFTPPEFANRMLDTLAEAWAADHGGANMWADKSLRFLDPCTKSGVFLREIVRRLTEGLSEELPDLEQRVEHILTNQVYGIGITRLTAMLARRSVYCSRNAQGKHSIGKGFENNDGNIWFERTRHKWENNKCEFCGAAKDTFARGADQETHAYAFIHTPKIKSWVNRHFGNMQFDVVIGNPPYQLDDGGFGTSAVPIYQHFVEQAKKLQPRYLTMVIPSRWFAGGKGLDEFRASMLNDDRIRSIDDYLSAADVFPGVGLKGGVCYFLWNREERGECSVRTHFKDWHVTVASRPLLEAGADVFIRFNEGLSILKKVVAKEAPESQSILLPVDQRFEDIVGPRKPFGISTTFVGLPDKRPDDVLIYRNGGIGYANSDAIPSGHSLINSWKIYVGYAAPGTGNKDTYPHRIISTPFIGEPGTACSETYLCIGPFTSRGEAESALSYLSCKLTRLLILLHKSSQHVTSKVYRFVPRQKWDRIWTDETLYEKYGISVKEQEFIEKLVRPLEVDLFGELVRE